MCYCPLDLCHRERSLFQHLLLSLFPTQVEARASSCSIDDVTPCFCGLISSILIQIACYYMCTYTSHQPLHREWIHFFLHKPNLCISSIVFAKGIWDINITLATDPHDSDDDCWPNFAWTNHCSKHFTYIRPKITRKLWGSTEKAKEPEINWSGQNLSFPIVNTVMDWVFQKTIPGMEISVEKV